MALLRQNLVPPHAADSLDHRRLDDIVALLAQERLTPRSAMKQYQTATDSGRWPILVVRPARRDVEAGVAELTEAGYLIDENLANAYAQVNLIPVRVPPEPVFIEHLAELECVERAERSWMKAQLPEAIRADDRIVLHPDHILQRSQLPSELLSKRDPLRIGLIDSGLDATHPALKTRLLDQRVFRRGLSNVGDQVGHGTATAGIIARLCTAATFLSAKVVDQKRHANLDDLVRAVGWLKRHRPDVLLCNILLPVDADGRSIMAGMMEDLVRAGVVVVVPAADANGTLLAPAGAQRVISVCTDNAPATCPATLRVKGHPVLAPRSIQADKEAFATLDMPKWTALGGPATSAAIVAGSAALMIRAARFCRLAPSPREIQDALLDHHDGAMLTPLDPDEAIQSYILKVTGMAAATTTGKLALGVLHREAIAEAEARMAESAAPQLQPELTTQPITPDMLKSLRDKDTRPLPTDFDKTVQGDIPQLPPYSHKKPDIYEQPTIQGDIPTDALFAEADATRPMDLSHLASGGGLKRTVDGQVHPPRLDLSSRGESEATRLEIEAENWPDNTRRLQVISRGESS